MDEPHNYELAEMDYSRGMKYKDIAEKYGVSLNTVKSWKTRYKWTRAEKKCVHTKPQKVRTQPEKVCTQNPEVVADEVKQVMSNQSLTDKQRLFCLHYIRCFNATKAAIKAGYSQDTAMEQGYQLLHKPSVREEISRLKQGRLNRAMLDAEDLFQKYMDIAFADITDYVEFGREDVQVMGAFGPVEVEDPETGEKRPLTKRVNTVRFRESSEVDGSLISEVKQGKDGASLKLISKEKALDWLAEHMDLASTNQRIQFERLKIDLLKAESEIKKNEPAAESGDDGFLDALKASAKDVWADET